MMCSPGGIILAYTSNESALHWTVPPITGCRLGLWWDFLVIYLHNVFRFWHCCSCGSCSQYIFVVDWFDANIFLLRVPTTYLVSSKSVWLYRGWFVWSKNLLVYETNIMPHRPCVTLSIACTASYTLAILLTNSLGDYSPTFFFAIDSRQCF